MIECRGWKRLEANRMFKFQDVSKKDFNAILRRSLVWRAQARFEAPQAIEGVPGDYLNFLSPMGLSLSNPAGAYDDIYKDGIFPKDSSLKEFLVSGPAVLAALQMQVAFEMP